MSAQDQPTSVAELNSKHFDQVALDWGTNPVMAEMSRKFAQGIKQVFEKASPQLKHKPLHVMDFGAGTGTLSFLFLHAFHDMISSVEAVDVSQGMLDQLNQKKMKLVQEGLMEETKLKSHCVNLGVDDALEKASFDVIVSSMAFHHVENLPEKLFVLNGYLRPGGVLIFLDMDGDDGFTDTFHPSHMKDEVPYLSGFKEKELREWLEKAGFENYQFHRNVTVHKMGCDQVERDYTLMTTCAFKK